MRKTKILFTLLFFANTIFGQTSSGSNLVVYGLLGVAVLVIFLLIVQVADNLLGIEEKKVLGDESDDDVSMLPGVKGLFSPKLPNYVSGGKVTILKKGHDILLEGEAEQSVDESVVATRFAVQPTNFRGIAPIPKMEVEVGDEVKAGDPLFFDKLSPEIKYAAPVSGEVIEINRGAKRSIVEVVILADKEMSYRSYDLPDLSTVNRQELVKFLVGSGVWPLINQRPFDVVPSMFETPRDIFISTFDTAPLAPDANFIIAGNETAFQQGLDVLAKLTDGQVYLGLNAKGDSAPADAFTNAEGVVKSWFHGKHPAGNVGVQIHHTKPISTTDKVWTLGIQEVLTIGKLFMDGRFDASRVVAITGSETKTPRYVKTYLGASLEDLLKDEIAGENVRIISGDVLSGEAKAANQYLNAKDDQISVIEEGDYYEMFGWLLPITPRPSISNTFPNFLFRDYKFKVDTNTHGEGRAFVVTGQYEKVLPMDIFPQHLMKAILVNDFERMEGLGIHELSEEDIALCEFVCTSKQPLQKILRDGLTTMHEQS